MEKATPNIPHLNLLRIIFVFFFLINFQSIFSQTEKHIKALYILSFPNYIEWPQFEDLDTFKIGILSTDSTMIGEFNSLTKGKKIKNKPVEIVHFRNAKQISKTQILYVIKGFDEDIDNIIKTIKGKNTLLITEIKAFNLSMINLIVVNNTVKFEMNETLIASENLIISPDLIKLAVHSGEDWQKLYEKSGELLKQEREKVQLQKNELQQMEIEIKNQREIIANQTHTINVKENEINARESTLLVLKNEINQKLEILNDKNKQITKQKTDIQLQKKELEDQKKLFEVQSIKLHEQNDKLKLGEQKISEQEKAIDESQSLLKDQMTKIEAQRIVLILSIILLFAFIFIIINIVRAYNLKKRTNDELAKKNIAISNQKEELEAQKEILENANQELEKLSTIAKKTDNAIVITDAKGNIEWINEGYTNLYGYSMEELKESKKLNLIGEYNNLKINDLINVWFGDKKTISYQAQKEAKNGRLIWAQTTLTPLIDEEGNIRMLIGIDTDITRLKSAEEEIQNQKSIVEEKKNELQMLLKDLTDSLKYAKHIQNAILPPEKYVKDIIPNSFIFYQPKGFVSGDFYWVSKRFNNVYFAVVDCTGHGVPGAFMSIVGNNILNQAINVHGLSKPSDILNYLNEKVNNTLHQKYEESSIKDGMDIALCSLNLQSNEIEFAGALRPMYFVRKVESNKKTKKILKEAFMDKHVQHLMMTDKFNLFSIRGDKQPIGSFVGDNMLPFTNHKIKFEKGDNVYLFTDGFADQFGGPNGKKYKYRRLNKLIVDIQNMNMNDQKLQIEHSFNNWKKELDQVDDICFMGISI